MPQAISTAPSAAIRNQICKRRVVEDPHPARHAHQAEHVERHEGDPEAETQHQNETLPQNGSSRKPKAFGHQ